MYIPSFVRLFTAPFCNAGTENIYNGCRINAPAEASYDRAVFSSPLFSTFLSTRLFTRFYVSNIFIFP